MVHVVVVRPLLRRLFHVAVGASPVRAAAPAAARARANANANARCFCIPVRRPPPPLRRFSLACFASGRAAAAEAGVAATAATTPPAAGVTATTTTTAADVAVPQTQRYHAIVEFVGSRFCGWQRQGPNDCFAPRHLPSVQHTLENALRAVAGTGVQVVGASRTDSGVHAVGMSCHFDVTRLDRHGLVAAPLDATAVLRAVNSHLRKRALFRSLCVVACRAVGPEFHARRSALGKTYCYELRAACPFPSPLEDGLIWSIDRQLSVASMRAGLAHLVGVHDFSSFVASRSDDPNHVKDLFAASIVELPAGGDAGLSLPGLARACSQRLRFTFSASGFLYNQVRIMIGLLVAVGKGQYAPDDVLCIREARDRRLAPLTAPPCGLYLREVQYDRAPGPARSS